MVIEIAQKIGPATLTKVVRRHASQGDNKHERAGSGTQPRWVHVSLPGFIGRWSLSRGSSRR